MVIDSPLNWPAVERGRGGAVVFLHGYPLTHEMWAPQLESLSGTNHIVLFDLPGFGLAQDWPAPDTVSGFAESVSRTLARRFTTPVVVVGHSFGGYVALELIRSHPGQVAGLVLTNTRSEPDNAEARAKRLATVQRLEDPRQHLDVDEVTRGVLAPATWERGGPVVDKVRAMVRSVPSESVVAALKAIAGRPDLTPVLSSITVPTLVLWGEEDRLIPPAQTRAMVGRIKNGLGAGIPGAGHLPSLEAPDRFAELVQEQLARRADL
jgi:pimeloyl-ACP methyl ester carboxylesterase